jgi:NAD(P)-dependent dehydrogenase (short-subunit alcohol dehydrogenase family)
MSEEGRFSNKVALVTGGASGIGAATVRALRREGASVAVGDINADGLAGLESELGEGVATLRCDVREEEDLAALVGLAADRFGRLDAAFNVAGGGEFSAIVDEDPDGWRFTVDLCLTGVFYGIKHEARQMIAQGGGGAIVNVASMNARMPVVGCGAYCAAKAGVVMLSQVAALELGEHGVRVNAVSPGHVKTPMNADLEAVPGIIDTYVEQTPLSRVGTTDDITAALLFLASEEATFVSGADLLVDGGFSTTTHFDLRPYMPQIEARQEG